jgi:hypothetical protein
MIWLCLFIEARLKLFPFLELNQGYVFILIIFMISVPKCSYLFVYLLFKTILKPIEAFIFIVDSNFPSF